MTDLAPGGELAAAWGRHLGHGRRRSAHTVRAYVATANRLLAFLTRHEGEVPTAASLARVEAASLRAFLAQRRGEGIGNASAAREMAAVRGFLAFTAAEAGEAAALPRLRNPKRARTVPRPVSPGDAVALAEDAAGAAAEPWLAARDLAVLLLLYGAGLRVGEAVGLDAGVLPLGEALRVRGKGDKERLVPLLPPVRAAVEDYARLAPFDLGRGSPLFRGARGGRLDAGMIRRAVRAARGRLGLGERTTPHALRHSFATHLLARGGGPAVAPGAAGAREPVVDAGLHGGGRGAPAGRVPDGAPAGWSGVSVSCRSRPYPGWRRRHVSCR